MESASIVHSLSLEKTPREGQLEVLKHVAEPGRRQLNIKLPTGYGKTFTAYASYHLLKKAGRVNRLLFIVPTDAQLKQLEENSGKDYRATGLHGIKQVVDVRRYGDMAIKYHRKDTHEIYAITPQSLIQRNGTLVVHDLLARGNWMIVVDEYHHYGIDGAWGKSVVSLPHAFLLAMSATPDRPGEDGAFGKPDVPVTYREAVKQLAVKPLRGHSYVYRIDAIGDDGEILSYTTSELAMEAGGDDPDKVEKLRIDRKLRWSPKYISPLVSIPLERMIRDRLATGRQLRAIIGCMCVSHAQMVCVQVAAMFPEVSVDWVGTGLDGRRPDENRAVIRRFLMEERESGALDVLVHVGIAGEGLDSRLVSEVIHLNRASMNNSNHQENGRASRYLEDTNGNPVIGNINFDSRSEYADYAGAKMELAMDELPPSEEENEEAESRELEYKELPEEPAIFIQHVELESIDSGSPEIVRMKKALTKVAIERGYQVKPDWLDNEEGNASAIAHYRKMRSKEASEFNTASTLAQWSDAVRMACSNVTGLAIRAMHGENRIDKGTAGDIKKRINSMKRRHVGSIENADIENLRLHWQWLRNLEQTILKEGVPSWLA